MVNVRRSKENSLRSLLSSFYVVLGIGLKFQTLYLLSHLSGTMFCFYRAIHFFPSFQAFLSPVLAHTSGISKEHLRPLMVLVVSNLVLLQVSTPRLPSFLLPCNFSSHLVFCVSGISLPLPFLLHKALVFSCPNSLRFQHAYCAVAHSLSLLRWGLV